MNIIHASQVINTVYPRNKKYNKLGYSITNANYSYSSRSYIINYAPIVGQRTSLVTKSNKFFNLFKRKSNKS
jgi:hypothetical protein